MTFRFRNFLMTMLCCGLFSFAAVQAQVENVPVANQVYEFLDRMGVKRILPLYSNTMIPLSRREVAELLQQVAFHHSRLNNAERDFLYKFEREFASWNNIGGSHIIPAPEEPSVLFRDGFEGLTSYKEKYLYTYEDSSLTAYVEFLGTLEYRAISGDTYGSTHASFEQHGGRIRGTVKNKLGYFLQATNGTLYGDKDFALSDPRLRGNVKFKDLNTPYFDFSEAYLRADLSWFNLQFGREYMLVGTGYSDRLLLSDNASLYDFVKLDARYRSVRFLFVHGSILGDSNPATGLLQQEPANSTKYLVLHRLQISLFDRLNFGASEMTIYQRYSPEFAYLNPIIFYKSVEHSLRDRDNSFLNFDLEYFPAANYKLYGTWLIDDIDFSKMGTGWWGNEFGWQGGLFAADVAGLANLDAVVEYTRLEPYVYSNRVAGNDYTHNDMSLGHHLPPNSDEWFAQLSYRPCKQLRTWLTYARTRHGENIYDNAGQLVRNVGGDVLQGHRSSDSDVAEFLDGNLVRTDKLNLRAVVEPITNFFASASYEYRRSDDAAMGTPTTDHYGAFRIWVEY